MSTTAVDSQLAAFQESLTQGRISNDGGRLRIESRGISRSVPLMGYVEWLRNSDGRWEAYGWAADPLVHGPCRLVVAASGLVIRTNAMHVRLHRPDVNYVCGFENDTQVGFQISGPADGSEDNLEFFAVLNSGLVVPIPGPYQRPARIRRDDPAPLDMAAWQKKFLSPLYELGGSRAARGIYSFDPNFDPKAFAGVTSQFLEDAEFYHQTHTSFEHWGLVLAQAFSRSGILREVESSILNIGAGSGNTVIPLFDLLPKSVVVAADISPPLLALLRDQVNERHRDRLLLLAVDARERRYARSAFDLVIGSGILHHMVDPEETISACAEALKPGGKAIFFEPFEIGYVVLRLLYEQLLATQATLGFRNDVADLFRRNIIDTRVRTGTDKTGEIFKVIDDKWLFTCAYFDRIKHRLGLSDLQIYSLEFGRGQFSSEIRMQLNCAFGPSGHERLPRAGWEMIADFEQKFSRQGAAELLMAGCIIFSN